MNSQLLEEIKRFRQMSKLPILENLGSKMLINEGRGDSGTAIWRMILQTGESTAEAEASRLAKITKMFEDYRVKLSPSNIASPAEEQALRRGVVDEVNRMVRSGSTTKEIVDFLATKLGKEEGGVWSKINNAIDEYVDQEVKNSITKALTNTNDPIHKELVKDFEDEVSERMNKMDEAGDSPLVKKAVLDAMKADFIKTYKSLLGFDVAKGEGKAVDDLFEIPYKGAVSKLTPNATKDLGWASSIMTFFRGAPLLLDQFSELINLSYLAIKKETEVLEAEISDILIRLEQGSVQDKNAGKLISDRIKTFIINSKKLDEFCNDSYTTLYNDIIKKIKDAIPDETLRNTILSKIEEIESTVAKKDEKGNLLATTAKEKINALEIFFNKLDTESDLSLNQEFRAIWEKIKEFFSFFKNPFGTTFKDYFGKVYDASAGWATRWWQYAMTGTLSSFKDYIEEMSKKRRNVWNQMTFGKKGKRYVSGYGWGSIIDMYIRIWFRANVFIPLTINFLLSIGGWLWACGFNTVGDKEFEAFGQKFGGPNSVINLVEDSTYQKYCKAPIRSLMANTWEDIADTFGPFALMFNGESDSIGEWLFETWDFIIPFNTQLDDMINWYFTGDPEEKVKEVVDEQNDKDQKTSEEELNKIDPKLLVKKEKEVINGKMAVMSYAAEDPNYTAQLKTLSDLVSLDSLSKDTDPMITYNNNIYHLQRNRGGWSLRGEDGYTYTPKEFVDQNMGGIKTESIIRKIRKILMEDSGKKFGDDNFKHWKDTFTFKSVDEKNPGQYKEVKINMEDVMDRINHYRKKYDEDDAFVRAVIDTHEDVVKVMFTKDLAHLQENFKPKGLAIILQQIRESRGEMEIWSVSRPANGNWFLVKGDYTPNQLANMDLEKKEPQPKEKEVDSRTEDDLKKKEELALHNLKSNEKEGINDLPKQVRDKVNEKLSKGWTTEEPFFAFEEFYEVSEINSVFNDKIKIYKLNPSEEFFKALVKESASVRVSSGFCKTLNQVKNQSGLVERQQKVLNHFIQKCENKFGNEPIKKYRQARFND